MYLLMIQKIYKQEIVKDIPLLVFNHTECIFAISWSHQLTIFLVADDLFLYCRLGLQSTMKFSYSFWISQLTKQETAVAVFLHDLRSAVACELAKPVAGVDDGIIENLSISEHKDRVFRKKTKSDKVFFFSVSTVAHKK